MGTGTSALALNKVDTSVNAEVRCAEETRVVVHVAGRKYTSGFEKMPLNVLETINKFLTKNDQSVFRISHKQNIFSKMYDDKLSRIYYRVSISYRFIYQYPNLVQINLGDTDTLNDISPLTSLQHSLQDLNLSGCRNLWYDSVETLTHLTELRKLDIRETNRNPQLLEDSSMTRKILPRLTALPKLCELKTSFYLDSIKDMDYPNLLCLELDIKNKFPNCNHQYSKFSSFKKLETVRVRGLPVHVRTLLNQGDKILSLLPALKTLELTTVEDRFQPPEDAILEKRLLDCTLKDVKKQYRHLKIILGTQKVNLIPIWVEQPRY